MNKLIRELAEHCDFYVGNEHSDKSHEEKQWLWAEKFTEMIVLECENVAKNPKWYSESPSNGWRNPIRHVCNEMKEHFGVRE